MTASTPSAAEPGVLHAKRRILEDLGQSSLVLPLLVNRGLEGNDRAKYLLALLQTAVAHADDPARPAPSLRSERLAAGIVDDSLDRVVEGARAAGDGWYLVPGSETVHAALLAAVGDMLAPLEAADGADGALPARFEALVAAAPDLAGDRLPGAYLDRLASADRAAGDSLHLLVMDAHRALNRLQAEVATEVLDGAAVYRLDDADRPLVSAFMAGVRSTEGLRFAHPGLTTTATRAGERLLIQNDIGLTEAHVIVVTVEGPVATLTYTDDHLGRLIFFESMLDPFAVEWSDARHRRGQGAIGDHHLVTGRYAAPDGPALEAYLRHLGSRLVFLIDWNRARKRLGAVVPNKAAVALLRWAADNDLGHMAFLQMGAERLVFDAAELAGRAPARYGEQLRDVLGDEGTVEFLRFALRAASEGASAGKSELLVRDELRVEMQKHVRARHQELLDAAAEHGSLVAETALALRAALLRLGLPDGDGFVRRASRRARAWEHHADEILVGVRQAAQRMEGADPIARTVSSLDDAIDDLEDAIFLLTLLPADAYATVRPILDPLGSITASAAREQLKALEIARDLVQGSDGEELEDFLVAIDQVATLEHEADRAERAAQAAMVAACPDFRSLHVAAMVTGAMEDATDALARSAYRLREHVLAAVTPR
jgi:uncharacterized protein Yka (UPF0111/DUF47 family)